MLWELQVRVLPRLFCAVWFKAVSDYLWNSSKTFFKGEAKHTGLFEAESFMSKKSGILRIPEIFDLEALEFWYRKCIQYIFTEDAMFWPFGKGIFKLSLLQVWFSSVVSTVSIMKHPLYFFQNLSKLIKGQLLRIVFRSYIELMRPLCALFKSQQKLCFMRFVYF